MQLVIINIISNGSDLALVLNGELIITADPSLGEETSTVESVANNLSATLKIPEATVIDFEHDEDWNWHEVIVQLKKEGEILTSEISKV